jgi:Spy/CpxP family protein refolding chaperone
MMNMMQERMAERQQPREGQLTDEQREEMKALRLEHMKATTPIQNQLRELRVKQNSLISVESPDRGQIDAVLNEINALEGQLRKIRVEQQLATREILTEEQRVRIDAMKAQGARGAGMRQRGQMMRPMQGQGMMQRGRMMQRR